MKKLRVLVVGGRACPSQRRIAVAQVERFESAKVGGNGAIRRACACVASGTVDAVVLRVQSMGHSGFHALCKACRRHGVRFVSVNGGETSVRRAVRRLAGEVDDA